MRSKKIATCAIAVLTLAGSTAFATAASAGDTGQLDWGTVAPGGERPQADAWVAKIKGGAEMIDTAVFESHYPAIPQAPETQNGAGGAVDLTSPPKLPMLPKLGIGKVAGANTRAFGNSLPGTAGADNAPFPGAAFAEATTGTIDLGVPYIPNPVPEGVPLSPWGIHLDGLHATAISRPGKPVKLEGEVAGGYVYAAGVKLSDFPADTPPNTGMRVPQDQSDPAMFQLEVNEQVTVDSDAKPTLDDDGNYVLDPNSDSGYVNAVHLTLLGLNAGDVTVGHAAVLGAGQH